MAQAAIPEGSREVVGRKLEDKIMKIEHLSSKELLGQKQEHRMFREHREGPASPV